MFRHLLSRTLSRTEPNFLHKWMSGIPGSICLAKVDCVLIEDRRDHLYKYDPISRMWFFTSDGLKYKPFANQIESNLNQKLRHSLRRLILFTTDWEVYIFRFDQPKKDVFLWENPLFDRSTMNVDMPNDGVTFKKNLKQIVRNFIFNLCLHISFVRGSSGFSLAEKYIKQLDIKFKQNKKSFNNVSQSPSSPLPPAIGKSKSMNIFNRKNTKMDYLQNGYEVSFYLLILLLFSRNLTKNNLFVWLLLL